MPLHRLPYLGEQPDRGHWMFRDIIMWFTMQEQQGNRLIDISGHGYHGDLDNFSTNPWTAGDGGPALSFDGLDDVVRTVDASQIDGTDRLSFSAWVRIDDLDADHIICCKDVTFQAGADILFWRDESGAFRGNTFAILIDGDRVTGANNASSDTDWHHVAWTYRGGSTTGLRLYIDGVEDPNSPGDVSTEPKINNNSSKFTLGNADDAPAGGKFLEGALRDVRLARTVWTDAQIWQIMNNPWAPWERRSAPIFDTVAAAPTSIPVFMHHYKQMSGMS